ncbi:MAG: SAM-dependent methyltransferase [Actinomycetia bacterium]|nr:SAM-dependent methyltransferase [Actinomycetes bacterium]MCH9699894.1 SAM-dependent methyltransferase [Actinomycetes bacterium]MCH9761388.1 SAM-dependent methyltransferase [Actinomycetes bacterium]
MPESEPLVSHVSDTARWTAQYRATESARPDRLFKDSLAQRLAGDHGQAIAAGAPRTVRSGWWLVARTKIIDDIIANAISDGCDRVLNLAAGLDTRPYRLDLSTDFEWVEADLPGLLTEKTQLLADEKPRCRLTRTAVDLADTGARAAFLDQALAGASKALVLTEGLLMYLDDREVTEFSASLNRPEVAWWLLDYVGPGLRRLMNRKTGILQSAPFKFAPENGATFFEDLGWRVVELEPLAPAAHRFDRLPFLMRLAELLPQADPRKPGLRPFGAVACLSR